VYPRFGMKTDSLIPFSDGQCHQGPAVTTSAQALPASGIIQRTMGSANQVIAITREKLAFLEIQRHGLMGAFIEIRIGLTPVSHDKPHGITVMVMNSKAMALAAIHQILTVTDEVLHGYPLSQTQTSSKESRQASG